MNRFSKIIWLLALLFAGSRTVTAQIDTVFWFAAPWVTPDHAYNIPMAFRISTFGNTTTVRIKQPASTYDTTFTVGPNTIFSKFVTHIVDSLESKPANQVINRGFRITSDFPITVVYEFLSQTGNNPETYSLKGMNGMGTEFITPFQTLMRNRTLGGDLNGDGVTTQPYSYFSVVATQNNTTIWITPRCAVVGGHPANVTYSVTLNAGQVYTCQNVTQFSNVPGQNLGGSIVVSDKPVSITVNDDSVSPYASPNGGCYDLMGDQIVPVDVIGKEYIVIKGQLNSVSNESLFAVATQNFTTVTITSATGTTTQMLNKGDTKSHLIPATDSLTYIVADKPIYLIHMSGYGCELGQAILPPLNCAGSNQVSFTRTNAQGYFLNLLCPSGAEGAFLLNGNPTLVPASAFRPVPGTAGAWMGAQIQYTTGQIPVGTAMLLTNSVADFSMGVFNGGTSTGCFYHYMSSFVRKVFTSAGNDVSICTSLNPINLTGSVSGGAISGIWTTPDGTGSFGSPTSLLTNYTPSPSDTTKPFITLILTSTGNCNPVSDTMVIYFNKSPIVNAGGNTTICKNNVTPVQLNGAVSYAIGGTWSGGNGGVFGNVGSLNTTYTPSPADISAGQATLVLTSSGSFFGCPNMTDTVVVTFTNPPSVSAGASAVVCANNASVNIIGSVTQGSSTGIWTSSGSGAFNPSNTLLNTTYIPSIQDISQGSVILTLTSTNNGNCLPVTDNITITITPAPFVNAGPNDTVCSNAGTINLNGIVAGGSTTGIWTTNGNGSFGNPNALSTTYTVGSTDTLAGFVELYLTSTGGNCIAVTDTVRLVIVNAPSVNAGPDMLVCSNQYVLLNGNVSGATNTGSWTSTGTGTFLPSNAVLAASYTPSSLDIASGSIQLILTSTNNGRCAEKKDTLTVAFIPAPSANFNTSNVCLGTVAGFTDNSSTGVGTITGWEWDFGDNGTSISQNAVHNYQFPGTYNVMHVAISNNGCRDTIIKPITVYSNPVANFFTNSTCAGSLTALNDSSQSISGNIVSWQWDFGNGNTSNLQSPTNVFLTPGVYTVSLIVTTNFGCKDTLLKPVTIIPGPVANFNVTPNPVEALENVAFTDLSTSQGIVINWNWNFGDTTLSNQQNPVHAYQSQGNYIVTLVITDQYGCVDTVKKDISVVLLPQVPTGFTPNGDGKNDFLFVKGGPFEKFRFRVYNNWGELLFETNDQKVGWDGTYKGSPQPLGVYVWVLDVETFNKKQINKSGDVTLMR